MVLSGEGRKQASPGFVENFKGRRLERQFVLACHA